ncbi:hypothetical protein BaRGS_00012562 [Batillaria attramentaria]|uniref:Uncharacterized protein n=1 Tax=Batillaria attramentaria TaxID=370345 RepID=A0ABD0LAI3_9CAEN
MNRERGDREEGGKGWGVVGLRGARLWGGMGCLCWGSAGGGQGVREGWGGSFGNSLCTPMAAVVTKHFESKHLPKDRESEFVGYLNEILGENNLIQMLKK